MCLRKNARSCRSARASECAGVWACGRARVRVREKSIHGYGRWKQGHLHEAASASGSCGVQLQSFILSAQACARNRHGASEARCERGRSSDKRHSPVVRAARAGCSTRRPRVRERAASASAASSETHARSARWRSGEEGHGHKRNKTRTSFAP
eukprot:2958371-Pleurochrysis_carterae.AAC.3